MDKHISKTEENYLKSIFQLSKDVDKYVSTKSIAELLNISPASVSDMLVKLKDKGLIEYVRYRGVMLSSLGEKKAMQVIRNHRLWEYFLVEMLEFGWEEVHEIAEELEHIQSARLIDGLDKFLGYPSHDPHGDPIPDKQGNITKNDTIQLYSLKKGEEGTVVGVRNDQKEFLFMLDNLKIHIGTKITVLDRFEYDYSMLVKIGENDIQLSHKVSQNLSIKKI